MNLSSKKSSSDGNIPCWWDIQYDFEGNHVIRPDQLEKQMKDPPGSFDQTILDRIEGSIIGMALGDALGAHCEFRPYEYMIENQVKDLQGGGTWSLEKGYFTDDTSMALCLANSLIACEDFVPYDQLVRYQWWYQHGYMSSTGQCFDIGAATSQSLREFQRRQTKFEEKHPNLSEMSEKYSDEHPISQFDVYCSENEVAGNGALMRLAPVPLFFYRNIFAAIEFSGRSGEITHGDQKAVDACRYFGALIAFTIRHSPRKDQICDNQFYKKHQKWFGQQCLHPEIVHISKGSYKKKKGYQQGIRGGGYIVKALEAALWAFWSTKTFEDGALAAVNLGDDTDTTAAIYGQLAGAFYGYEQLPHKWIKDLYAHQFMRNISKWIYYKGQLWDENDRNQHGKKCSSSSSSSSNRSLK